ncbi:MAG: exodeoxyribonuclease VII large subunit [Pseudomonadota bacterium]
MSFVHNQPEYSVSEIAGHVKRMVEDTFGHVRVRGEVSKTSINAASGHCYLSLKDDKAVLDAVCWKGTMAKLAHKPQAGMEMIATGKLTTYPGSSKYQLVIESLEPAGVGALMAMLEQRKKALEAEGLFSAERKQPLPFLPEVIGIVTSPTGAVIRDILHRLADRFPRQVLLWPVPVQGQGAAEKIAAAIDGFNAMDGRRPDVIIVARGGGSIEDLWAFNEEIVVRAAAASHIPLISAVGHETDTTLIDFAADKRAPTPTAAAELAVPVRSELLSRMEQLHAAKNTAMRKFLAFNAERIEGLARGLPRPQQLVAGMAQALDGMTERLTNALPRLLQAREDRLQRIAAGLSPQLLREMLRREQQRVQHIGAMLESLNVLSVLKRGFALVKDKSGTVMKAAAQLPANGALVLQFHDGEAAVQVGSGKPAAAKPRSNQQPPQPGLFDD